MPKNLPKNLPPSEKLRILKRVLIEGQSVSRVCRTEKISRATFYRWQTIYKSAKTKTASKKDLLGLFQAKKLKRHSNQVAEKIEKKILRLVLKHPKYSTKKIAQILADVGNHGVQNVLKRNNLNTYKKRLIYQKIEGVKKVKGVKREKREIKLTPGLRRTLVMEVVRKKRRVAYVCREFGISRVTFYRWKKRYETGEGFWAKVRKIERYWRQISEENKKRILSIIIEYPELSVPKIVARLPKIKGRPIVGYYGVQRVLERENLNTYEKRLAYAETYAPKPVFRPTVAFWDRLKMVWEKFVPSLAPAPPPVWKKVKPLLRSAPLITLLTSGFGFLFYQWLLMLSRFPPGTRIGLLFASIALTVGSFFFLYSMKYYLTIALILSFSRESPSASSGQVLGEGVLRRKEEGNGPSANSGWLAKIFNFNGRPGLFNNHQENGYGNGRNGLNNNVGDIKLERYPFVSIHLPFYNEKKVAKRILEACTKIDYPNFEIIVCDDSTDETVQIVQTYARKHNSKLSKQGKKGPFIEVLHRPNREGFKGGALAYAVKQMDPRTEFVVVFDADFVPYPDTLLQFLKHFKASAGTLDFSKAKNTSEVSKSFTSEVMGKSNIAVVGGYQWHVLNKSENWITRGVRTEYAGSYVIERPGQELTGALKQISGSVYMIRADVLKEIGWGTSITEDFQLTLKLYEKGYKVVYTPYVQAPAECVSTLKRLIRQRMRWAEGHSQNIKKMFFRLMKSPNLNLMEKLEVLYLSPYYLQAAFFLVGTLCWLISETVFKARLPFWTALWGWSLVLTNLFALPLMNSVGLFLEEAEERDYLGIFSFMILSYIVVPFQAYASIKGFLEKEEGGWFRTPKTGRITDIIARGRFYRWIRGILPWRVSMAARMMGVRLAPVVETYQPSSRLTSFFQNNPLTRAWNYLELQPAQVRLIARGTLIALLIASIGLSWMIPSVPLTYAMPDTFYFHDFGADQLARSTTADRLWMDSTTPNQSTKSFTLDSADDTFYTLTDTINKKWQRYENGNDTWSNTGNLNSIHYWHTATLLNNGKVLVAGSWNAAGYSSAELYDPSTGTWTNTGNLNYSHSGGHTATLLNNGKVLVAGSFVAAGYSSAELYDPSTGTWTNTGNLNYSHYWHTATLLNNGKVLVAGSYATAGYSSAELYDPSTGTWTNTGNLNYSHYYHTATLLNNGKVLVAGSYATAGYSSAELYDPSTGTWTNTGNLNYSHYWHTPTLLNNGKVLISGGCTGEFCATVLSSAELYDPSAGTWTNTGNLNLIHNYHTATLLNNGKVLVAGSGVAAGYSSAELYDPSTGIWTNTGNLNYSHYGHTATLLNNGKVLVAGSETTAGYSSSELFTPSRMNDLKISPNAPANAEQRNPDLAADSSGNSYVVWEDNRNSLDQNTWANTGNLNSKRRSSPSVLLNNAKVLIVGGYDGSWLSSSELFDPSTGSWSNTSNLNTKRIWSATTLLNNGKVLAAGGNDGVGTNYLSSCELFDPSTKTWTNTGNLNTKRLFNTATLLNNGKVLTVGGEDTSTTYLSSSELYDPSTGTWTNTGNLNLTHYYHTATLLNNGKLLVAGSSGAAGSSAELYDPSTGTWTNTGNLNLAHKYHTATLLNNGKVLVAGSGVTAGYSSAELYDPNTGTWTNTGNLNLAHYQHTATLLNNGQVLVAGGMKDVSTYLSSAELFSPQTYDVYMQKFNTSGSPQWVEDKRVNSDDGSRGTSSPNHPANYDHLNPKIAIDSSNNLVVTWQESRNSVYGDDIWAQKMNSSGTKLWPDTGVGTKNTWANTGNLNSKRSQPTAVLLNNGRVLAVGGTDATNSYLSSSELYDPSTGTWTNTGNLNTKRYIHTSVLLNNGKVLAVGGFNPTYLSSSELYDPQTASWTNTGNLNTKRYIHTSVLLNNGKVLAVGGYDGSSQLFSSELYDPSTATWTTTGNLNTKRAYHTSVLLNNGKVLTVGGRDTGTTYLSSSELYDPSTGTWTNTGNLNAKRNLHTSVLLNNGKVLTVGGYDGTYYFSSSELYDPSTATWTTTGNLNTQRGYHTSALLNNGKVLAVGGMDTTTTYLSSSELYDPSTGTWTNTGDLNTKRYGHKSVLLNNGKVLTVGGQDTSSTYLSSSELFTPSSDIPVSNDGSPSTGSGLTRPEQPDNGRGILGEQRNPVVAVDSSNDFVFAWEDTRFNTISNWAAVYFAYENNLGAGGACNGGGGTNNSCGAIPSLLSRPLRIMGQKINSAGFKQWGDDQDLVNKNNPQDLILSSTGDQNTNPAIATSGSEVYVAWETNQGTTGMDSREYNIYSQKFNSSGASQWGGEWSATGNLNTQRRYYTSVLLNNGKVLTVGGQDTATTYLSSSELYDPSTGIWTNTGNLNSKRGYHTSVLLNNGKVLVVGGLASVSNLSSAELYDADAGTWSNTGNMNTKRYSHAATLLNNGKVLVSGGWGAFSPIPSCELYYNGTWTVTNALTTSRYLHTAVLLNNGKLLVTGGFNAVESYISSSELYDPSSATWSNTGNLNTRRGVHTATLLNNGKVLVAGGYYYDAGNFYLSSSELYDPSTGNWTNTGNLNTKRGTHTSVLLNNGKVLVAGGNDGTNYLNSAEIYDPETGTWTVVDYLWRKRDTHTSILLANGKLLVAGGYDGTNYLSSSELYSLDKPVNMEGNTGDQRMADIDVDSEGNAIVVWQSMHGSSGGGGPSGWDVHSQKLFGQSGATRFPDETNARWSNTDDLGENRSRATMNLTDDGKVLLTGGERSSSGSDTWANTGNLNVARAWVKSVLLNTGQVLVAGGYAPSYYSSSELYNPSTGTWSNTGNMNTKRSSHAVTLLNNGKVMAIGGTDLSSSELYDPSTETWTYTGNMSTERDLNKVILLNSGKVLIPGGKDGTTYYSTSELYDPSTGTWSNTGNMNTERFVHAATLLNNGKVLVAGGRDSGGTRFSSCELYDPSTGTWTYTGNMNDKKSNISATLLSNGKVLVPGGWDGGTIYYSSAELYDPSTGTWSNTGNLNIKRSDHIATLLNNGKVLVAGGYNGNQLSACELYDPSTGTWVETDNMERKLVTHEATLLNNGKVLMMGGFQGSAIYSSSSELYDASGSETVHVSEVYNPDTSTWSYTGHLTHSRFKQTTTLMSDGTVLAVGGYDQLVTVSSTEKYINGIWFPEDTLSYARYEHTATLLDNRNVLVAGGYTGSDALSSSELFDGSTWTNTGSLTVKRYQQTATLLETGKVLVSGGYSGTDTYSSAELYNNGTWAAAGNMTTKRADHTANLLDSGKVLVVGGHNRTVKSEKLKVQSQNLISQPEAGPPVAEKIKNEKLNIQIKNQKLEEEKEVGKDTSEVSSSAIENDRGLGSGVSSLVPNFSTSEVSTTPEVSTYSDPGSEQSEQPEEGLVPENKIEAESTSLSKIINKILENISQKISNLLSSLLGNFKKLVLIKEVRAQSPPGQAKKDFRSDEPPTLKISQGKNKIGRVKVYGPGGKEKSFSARFEEVSADETLLILTPGIAFVPGRYHLEVLSKNDEILETQDFTWGVLAINVPKSIYLPNEKVEFLMTVLDDRGLTVCDAEVELKLTEPGGSERIFSTANGSIQYSDECGPRNFTYKPDFKATHWLSGQTGTYEMLMTATTENGTREIEDSFEVVSSVDFDVERFGPVRIYPPAVYEMRLKIKANVDFKGEVVETVPRDFEIISTSEVSESFTSEVSGETKVITWEVDWKAGESQELVYQFDAPDVSPYFYLLGPLRMLAEKEALAPSTPGESVPATPGVTSATPTPTPTASPGVATLGVATDLPAARLPAGQGEAGVLEATTAAEATVSAQPSPEVLGAKVPSEAEIGSENLLTRIFKTIFGFLKEVLEGVYGLWSGRMLLSLVRRVMRLLGIRPAQASKDSNTLEVSGSNTLEVLGLLRATVRGVLGWIFGIEPALAQAFTSEVSPPTNVGGPSTSEVFSEARQWQIAADQTQTVTYYFDYYDASYVWDNAYAYMVDGFTSTEAYEAANSSSIQLNNSNTCPGTDLGTISTVELRIHAHGDGDDNINLIPRFNGTTDGSAYNVVPGKTAGWSVWKNITSDVAGPGAGNWTWTHVDNLDVKVDPVSSGKPSTIYASKVEIQVTYTPPTINISGSCDQAADQDSDCTDTGTVRVAFNGNLQTQTQTTVAGSWIISGCDKPASGTVITVYIEGAAEANEAVGVTTYDGDGNVEGIALIEQRLSIGNNDNRTVSNTNLSQYDSTKTEDVFHTYSGGAITLVDTSKTYAEIYIKLGNTYQPGGTVTTHDMEINGTLAPEANTVNVSGSWDNNGTFTASSSTVVFTSTAAVTETIDSNGASTAAFNNLTFGNASSSTTWSLSYALDVDGTLTLSYGTLSNGANNITLAGDLTINTNGLYSAGAGTFTFDGSVAKNWQDTATSTQNLGTVVVDGDSKQVNVASTNVKATKITIGGDDTLALGSSGYTLTLTGSGQTTSRPLVINTGGTLNAGTNSIVVFTGTSTTDIESATYHDLQINSTGVTFYPYGAITVSGTFTIQTNTIFNGSTYTLTLSGTDQTPFVKTGTFTPNQSTVNYIGENATYTNVTATTYYNLQIGNSDSLGAARTYRAAGTIAVNNDLTVGPTTGTFTHIFDVNTNDPAITVSGSVTINSKGSYSASSNTSYPLTIAKNFTNDGTFNDNDGRVVFDTANTSILSYSANTTFHDFYCATDSKTIQFDDTYETIIDATGNFNIQPSSLSCSSRVTLKSETNDNDWDFNVTSGASYDVDYADIKDSDASVGIGMTANNSADLGGNTNWYIDAGACGITYGGICYNSEGGSAMGADKTVDVRVNGLGTYTDETDANGYWEKAVVAGSTDVITAYLDDEGTDEATTVLVSNGVGQTNVDLYKGVVIVRDDAGSNITNTNLGNGVDGDDDVKYNVASGNLTVNSGFELHVWTGDTFAPGGNVTTTAGNFHIDDNAIFSGGTTQDHDINGNVAIDALATLTAPSTEDEGTIAVSGNWTNVATGIFAAGSGKVTFDGSGTPSITTASDAFYDLTFNGSGTFTLSDTITVNEKITVTNGTVNTSNNVGVGSTVANSGSLTVASGKTFNQTAGTTTLQSSNGGTTPTIGGAGSTTFYDLDIGVDSDNKTYTFTTAGNITVSHVLTIQNGGTGTHTLNGADDTLTLAGSTDPFVIDANADFAESASTVKYTGSAATNIKLETYYNLYIHPGGAVSHRFPSGTTTITNLLSVGDGVNAGTADANTNDATVDVNGSLTINANGTFSAHNTNSLYIAKNFTVASTGTFTHNSGTVVFDTNNNSTLSYGANVTFNNFQVSGIGAQKNMTFDKDYRIIIVGTATLNGGACGTMIVLDSEDSATQFEIDIQGASPTLTFLSISNSKAITGISATNSWDVENNSGWTLIDEGECPPSAGYHASCEVYDPTGDSWTATGNLSTARSYHATILMKNGKVLAVGGKSDETTYLSSVELYDPATGTWASVYNLTTARAYHAAQLMNNGKVILAGGYNGTNYLSSSEVFEVSDIWENTGNLNSKRYFHTSVLLNNGKVLTVGGNDGTASPYLSSSELYDPSTGTWANTGNLNSKRERHTSVLLNNGKVLTVGGYDGTASPYLSSSELYDPQTASWTNTGNLNTQRRSHTSVLLNNGKVLTVGGYDGSVSYLSSSELYDPQTASWTNTGNLNTQRHLHTSVLLNNGKVLTVGGYDETNYFSSSELYDPQTGTWANTGNLNTKRYDHTATVLNNGKVLTVGGINPSYLSSSELYDPQTASWTNTGNLNTQRRFPTSVLLNNGKVLTVGGISPSYLSSSELYDPQTASWTNTGNLNTQRRSPTSVLLNNGKVLIVGGLDGTVSPYLFSSELYIPDGERPVSVDHSSQGNQTNPKISITDENYGIVVWEDDLNNFYPAYYGDSNGNYNGNKRILMQKIHHDTGSQQWPTTSKALDIRVDTNTGTDNYLRGSPMVDVWTDTTTYTRYAQFAWWDGRLINTEANVGKDIYGQKYDTSSYSVLSGNWTVYYYVNEASPGSINLNVSITEWDGQNQVASSGQVTRTPNGGGVENNEPFSAPTTTDITMRRLRATFAYNSGNPTTIEYGSSTRQSRLVTGTVIPERGIPLIFLALFLPRIIHDWEKRRRQRQQALAYALISETKHLRGVSSRRAGFLHLGGEEREGGKEERGP